MGFFIHFNSFCNPTRDGSKNKNISYHQPATSANLYKTVPCSENASMWALGFKSSNCSPPEMNLLLLICDHPTCASSCRQMSTSPDAGRTSVSLWHVVWHQTKQTSAGAWLWSLSLWAFPQVSFNVGGSREDLGKRMISCTETILLSVFLGVGLGLPSILVKLNLYLSSSELKIHAR